MKLTLTKWQAQYIADMLAHVSAMRTFRYMTGPGRREHDKILTKIHKQLKIGIYADRYKRLRRALTKKQLTGRGRYV